MLDLNDLQIIIEQMQKSAGPIKTILRTLIYESSLKEKENL